MTTVLKMIFLLENGKRLTFNLKSPDTTKVTKTAVNGWMQAMIDDQMILSNNNYAQEIYDAYLYETNLIDLP